MARPVRPGARQRRAVSDEGERSVGDTSPSGLPSLEAVRQFVTDSPGHVGKREIARHFNLGPEHRVALRRLMKQIGDKADTTPVGRNRPLHRSESNRLPDVTVVQVTGTDHDGDAIAKPVDWRGQGPPPMILMVPEPAGRPALAPGQRVLARLKPTGQGKYEGRTMKRLSDEPGRILGVFRAARGSRDEARIIPTDRRAKAEWLVPAGEHNGAEDGEIVLGAPLSAPGRHYGPKPARVVERLGAMGDARSVSLIVIHTHDIPTEFSAEALAEAAKARGVTVRGRTDLRDTQLVTIDGEDARDFDDAVYAEPHEGGFRLIVAIADVAHYVRPASALDRTARTRGNSCYFPDRVVPMLPEALSNGWCSLRPHEDRGCLFVEMIVDADGKKRSHSFGRGLMRSAARLTYEQVQQAQDAGDDLDLPLPSLYAAYRALLGARLARGTLDLDLPERKVILGDDGRVLSVAPRPRLDSHRLIEEFMVLANVCAAEELERLHRPCVYRIHAPPTDEKLANLRTFLRQFDISLPPMGQVHPRDLLGVLKKVEGTEHAQLVNEVMLRSQSQAAYDIENIGHFGLALSRYAHFTSPIRRYADLCVHRALITGLRLGVGGLSEEEVPALPDTCEHITATERRAALAERDAIDRYLAAFMADKVGSVFAARISGVTRFGLFVTVADSGASGLVPISSLPDDFWMHDEAAQTLTGRRSGLTFRLAQEVEARLAEASPITGGLIFQIMQGSTSPGGSQGGRGGSQRFSRAPARNGGPRRHR
jgi:ribonuclease R